jgi:hypothetical protein
MEIPRKMMLIKIVLAKTQRKIEMRLSKMILWKFPRQMKMRLSNIMQMKIFLRFQEKLR